MGPVAALYDIHANLPALDAVLAEARGLEVEALVIGGDVVPGPQPHETIVRLRECGLRLYCLQGNGDREVVAARRGQANRALPAEAQREIARSAEQLSDDDEAWLSGWSSHFTLNTTVGAVFFCHATARNDTEIITVQTAPERLERAFAAVAAPTIVCGHTHMQFDRQAGRRRIVNAGSVGMPFGDRRGGWVLIGAQVELRQTVVELFYEPPSEAAMLELYRKAELI